METEKAKMVFAGAKQFRRCNDTDLIKAAYATIQISVTEFHSVTQQLAPNNSSKFSQIDGAERFYDPVWR